MLKPELQDLAKSKGIELNKEDGKEKTVSELNKELEALNGEASEDAPEREADPEPLKKSPEEEEDEGDTPNISSEADKGEYNLSVFLEENAIDAISKFRNKGDKTDLVALLDLATA